MSGKNAHRKYFTNSHIIIYLIFIFYNFSDFTAHILFYIILLIASCHLPKRRDSLRLLVIARNIRPVAHLRFQARLFPAIPRNPCTCKPNIKNTIPVILSGVNEEFRN